MLVGSGGREHALAWKIGGSPLLKELVWTPGNGGLRAPTVKGGVAADDLDGLMALAERSKVDLTVIGPEAPLSAGVVDRFSAAGLKCFGPSALAARLESSKSFAKEFCIRHGIPTGAYRVFDDPPEAVKWASSYGGPFPLVLKADGLAAGKGVVVCFDATSVCSAVDEIMVQRIFGRAGDRLLVEDFLVGEEASLLAFCDGSEIRLMPPARDYKKVGEGDVGPNTGGMGAFCPSPRLSPQLITQVAEGIIQKVVDGMAAEGSPFRGILYAGLMLTENGPKVLEFNCRFGDPETQVVLPMLDGDILPILAACAEGSLKGLFPKWKSGAALTVVLCSGGYPGSYAKGKRIEGVERAASHDGVTVFHAGTRIEGGSVLTDGGRVLNVTAVGETLKVARDRAYAAVSDISFDGMMHRKDIGASFV